MKKSIYLVCIAVLSTASCMYDANPPSEEFIHDEKPRLMVDASGFASERLVELKYTDVLGVKVLSTNAEKTDSTGRFLYPLLMERGTHSYSVELTVDQNGDGIFGNSGDYKTTAPATGAFSQDTQTLTLRLGLTDFTLLP